MGCNSKLFLKSVEWKGAGWVSVEIPDKHHIREVIERIMDIDKFKDSIKPLCGGMTIAPLICGFPPYNSVIVRMMWEKYQLNIL